MFEVLIRTLQGLQPVLDKHGCSMEFNQANIYIPDELQLAIPDQLEGYWKHLVEGDRDSKYEWLIEEDVLFGVLTVNLEDLEAAELAQFFTDLHDMEGHIALLKSRLEDQCETCEHCPDEWDPDEDEENDWCCRQCSFVSGCPFYEQ